MNNLTIDLRVNNARKSKSKFDVFWDISSKLLEELSAVNDRRYCPDCPGLEETGEGDVVIMVQIPILAKRWYNSRALQNMMQKCMIRKQHDDEHYCACVYKYLRSMARRTS